MRPVFVKTENVERFNSAMVSLKKRGAEENCLIVLDGLPGLGKTTSLKHWVAQNSCIYMRAKKEWTSSWFMRELLENLRVHPPHSFQNKFKLALKELGSRNMMAMNTGKTFALVIDEADHVSGNGRIIETIRDLSDNLEMPTILVGMGKIRDNLSRFPQVASRVSQYVRFEPASKTDIAKFIGEICEVPVGGDLIEFTHRVTGGFNREIKEAIANIERFGLRNPPDDDGVSMQDMAGQFLINDRRSGKAIHIPEVF
jgi:DNA transposition AAA+ family ATPase